jgi:hypothetical protein
MWQSQNQRTQAAQISKKRQEERLARPMHLQRVRAEIRLVPPEEVHGSVTTESPQGEICDARIMLNDLSVSGIGIYAAESMAPGLAVRITLQEPHMINVEGKVIWCQDELSASRILSARPFPFRIGIQFTFKTPEEENVFRATCEDLRKNRLYAPKSG